MTGQDWTIIAAGWVALAVVIAGLMADQRRIERRLDRHRTELGQHHRRVLHLEATAAAPLTDTRAPMPTIGTPTHSPAERPEPRLAMVTPAPTTGQQGVAKRGGIRALFVEPDPDDTWRGARPPSVGSIEELLAGQTRPLTRSEIARRTGLQLSEVDHQLRALYTAHVVDVAQGHDVERGWVLADPTTRMAHRHLTPGASR